MDMTPNEIKKILNESIKELLEKDSCLLEVDVSERAITHKLAEYLQRQIPYLNVDCEYNRNTSQGNIKSKGIIIKPEPKSIISLRGERISTFPDIIVHRRMRNDENLLIVEVKKRKARASCENDFRKLKAFTENTERNSYHFKYGVFILLNTGNEKPQKTEVTWFREGRIAPEM